MTDNSLFWDDLLLYMEQKQVIPIIGQDLLVVEQEGRQVNALRLLAERFADDLRISRDDLPPDFTLSHVIAAYPRFREKRNLIYGKTKALFDGLKLEVPEPLRLLARIPVFRVFVSTTFDPWLEQALIAERFDGLTRSIAIPYTPEEKPDLNDQQINSDEPVIFQLFGRIGPEPRYAVTEEDLLEYLYSLQQRPPENLCDVLRGHHLLCVGNAFSDWLARFFIRTARGERLITRANEVFFVDNELRRSSTLKSFFQGFCWGTNMLEENTPVEFVRLLYQKWCERHPETTRAAANSTPQPAEVVVPQRAGGSHSLFISYANEDAPAANRLHDCLKKVGLNVWLDKQGGLTEGDAYRAKIRQDIARCTLFLPVLSRNTERRKEGFFREEWYEAIQRLPRFKGSSRPFIMPIVIDDLPIYEATDIPEEFKQLHMTRAPGGELPEEVTTRYQQIVRGIIKSEGALQ